MAWLVGGVGRPAPNSLWRPAPNGGGGAGAESEADDGASGGRSQGPANADRESGASGGAGVSNTAQMTREVTGSLGSETGGMGEPGWGAVAGGVGRPAPNGRSKPAPNAGAGWAGRPSSSGASAGSGPSPICTGGNSVAVQVGSVAGSGRGWSAPGTIQLGRGG